MLRYGNSDVYDISSEVEDEEMKRILELSAIVRSETLDYCYSLENYEALSLEEKNKIYDSVSKKISKKYGLEQKG